MNLRMLERKSLFFSKVFKIDNSIIHIEVLVID